MKVYVRESEASDEVKELLLPVSGNKNVKISINVVERFALLSQLLSAFTLNMFQGIDTSLHRERNIPPIRARYRSDRYVDIHGKYHSTLYAVVLSEEL